MLLSSLMFVFTSSFIKAASIEANHFQAVFFRSIIPIPMILAIARQRNISVWGTKRKLLFLRGFYGALQLQFFIYAIINLRLGDVTIIASTWPLFVALLSPSMTKEKTPAFIFWMIPLFLISLSLIIKPSSNFQLLPTLSAVSTAVGVAIISLIIRRLKNTDPPLVIVFYFVFFSTLLALPTVIYFWKPLSSLSYLQLFFSGLTAFVAQMSITQAYRLGAPSFLSLFSYSSPVFAYVIGVIFFGEYPDIYALIGTALIIVCGMYSIKLNNKDTLKNKLTSKATL